MAALDTAHVPSDPLDWRPQFARASRRPLPIRDPIVEPLWSGWRVIIHFDSAHPDEARLLDAFGDDVSATEPAVIEELGRGVLAVDAVIDGILTWQATQPGEGIAVTHEARLSSTAFFLSRDPGIDVERRGQSDPSDVALVCIDLLRVDGQSLLDLPLLERKRLLESVVSGGERVRLSPFTRPPLERWVASWKAAGFKGAMLKAANGRYVPGRASPDWTPITRVGRG